MFRVGQIILFAALMSIASARAAYPAWPESQRPVVCSGEQVAVIASGAKTRREQVNAFDACVKAALPDHPLDHPYELMRQSMNRADKLLDINTLKDFISIDFVKLFGRNHVEEIWAAVLKDMKAHRAASAQNRPGRKALSKLITVLEEVRAEANEKADSSFFGAAPDVNYLRGLNTASENQFPKISKWFCQWKKEVDAEMGSVSSAAQSQGAPPGFPTKVLVCPTK